MAEKFREQATVLANEHIGTGIFDLRLRTSAIAAAAKPGQFVSVYSSDKSRLLTRPISICGADAVTGELRLVFRVAGKGTEEFSMRKAGDIISLTGPLGNGFPLDRAFCAPGQPKKTIFLIGGGIGIPPMVQLAKTLGDTLGSDPNLSPHLGSDPNLSPHLGSDPSLSPHLISVLGFRDELFLVDDLRSYGDIVIATEDGSCGTRGNVLDAIRENSLKADVIYACGPTPMLCALKKYAEETGTECWLSLEEKMACGIGACLSCVCKSAEIDGHSKVRNKRVCTEGPVFLSTEVEL